MWADVRAHLQYSNPLAIMCLNSYNLSEYSRFAFTLLGSVLGFFAPAAPYLLICTLLVFADCLTAWSLSRRVARTHPSRTRRGGGKFNSRHFGAVIMTLLKTWALLCLAFLIELYITSPAPLTKIAAGAVAFWQIWSILENESSCNGAKWARVMQRILVDKTERHFDIDLHELKDND